METTLTGPAATAQRLQNFPVSFFAVVMGLGGLTIAWQRAGAGVAGGALLVVTVVVFVLLALLYAAKLARYPQAVARREVRVEER
jgi:tellurite resistance protein